MDEHRNIIIFGILGIAGFFALSYVSSILFFFLSKYPVNLAEPWSVWLYLQYIGNPDVQSRLFVAIGFPFLGAAALAAKIYSALNEDTYADARWANRMDMQKAGLYKKYGLILGKYKGEYLINDDETHVICIAPTRSGKGTGLVIPNLMTWTGSIVCFDIKQENFEKTAGYRKSRGHDIFMFAPMSPDGKSHCFNPLDELSKDPIDRIGELEKIGKILMKEQGKEAAFWVTEGRALFTGLALYVLDHPEMPSTIGSIYRLLCTEQEIGEIILHISKTHKELDEATRGILFNFANKAEKERSGVKSSMSHAIELWKDPKIDAITSKSDFSFKDLRRRPMAIYVGVATGNIPAAAPLINLFFEQLMISLTTKLPTEEEPYKVLALLDEFHMLGRMDTVANVFTLAAGFNCRVMAVVQGLGWLDDVYGHDKRQGILSVCAHKIFFAANELSTAKYISDMCGDRIIETVSVSRTGGQGIFSSPSRSTSKRTYPLISKDRVTRLSKNKQIILAESSFPVKCNKVRYHTGADKKVFSQFLMPAPPVPDIIIERVPTPKFDTQKPSSAPTVPENPKEETDQTSFDFTENTEDMKDTEDPNDIVSDNNRLSFLLDKQNEEEP